MWSRRDVLQAGVSAAGLLTVGSNSIGKTPANDSLESLARARGMHFGTALGGRGLADTGYTGLIAAQCGIIVPENELKMPFVQRAPGEFQFDRADKLLEFAESHSLLMRGHCLLWHHPRWVPRWLATYDFGSDPRKSAEDLLNTHIDKTTAHYGKRISSWDVVNEAVDNITGEMRETELSKAMGSADAVIEAAFLSARTALPDAELVYNDYMSWEKEDAPHRDGVLRLLERLRKKNIPVDALGLQSHIGSGNTDGSATRHFDARDERAWRRFLTEVTGMGYSLLITEFDVHDAPLPADIPARDKQVAALGRDYLDVTLDFRQVNAVLAWGLADNHSWLQGRTPRADKLPKRPTPYDDHYQPKPLREAIAAAFRAAPRRHPKKPVGKPA